MGTERQHRYICYLASKAGYDRLHYAVADILGVSKSKCSRKIFTVKDASKMIDELKARLGE